MAAHLEVNEVLEEFSLAKKVVETLHRVGELVESALSLFEDVPWPSPWHCASAQCSGCAPYVPKRQPCEQRSPPGDA